MNITATQFCQESEFGHEYVRIPGEGIRFDTELMSEVYHMGRDAPLLLTKQHNALNAKSRRVALRRLNTVLCYKLFLRWRNAEAVVRLNRKWAEKVPGVSFSISLPSLGHFPVVLVMGKDLFAYSRFVDLVQ